MTQQNKDHNADPHQEPSLEGRGRENTGDSSAGSQAATTGYGTGESGGQGTAPAQQGKNTPSNAGDAGFKADEAVLLGDARTEQMSHADGSSEAHDPDV